MVIYLFYYLLLYLFHTIFTITNLIFFSGKRHDEKLLKTKNTHDNSGIPYTRCDKSEVKRQQIASNRRCKYLLLLYMYVYILIY